MIKVSVLYPDGPDISFDMNYYCETHIPLGPGRTSHFFLSNGMFDHCSKVVFRIRRQLHIGAICELLITGDAQCWIAAHCPCRGELEIEGALVLPTGARAGGRRHRVIGVRGQSTRADDNRGQLVGTS